MDQIPGPKLPIGEIPSEGTEWWTEFLTPAWNVDGPGDGRWTAVAAESDSLQLVYRNRGAFVGYWVAVEMWTGVAPEVMRSVMQDMVDGLNRCVDRGWFDLRKVRDVRW